MHLWRVLFILPVFIAACTKIDSDGELIPGAKRPEQEFIRGRVELFERDLLIGVVDADVIQQFQKESRVLLYGNVHAEDFDSTGQIRTVLDCDTLHVYRHLKDMRAIGHVEVRASEGESSGGPLLLITDWLEWKNRLKRIRTDAPVEFYTELDTLYGTGFSSDRHLKNWEITKPRGISHRGVNP